MMPLIGSFWAFWLAEKWIPMNGRFCNTSLSIRYQISVNGANMDPVEEMRWWLVQLQTSIKDCLEQIREPYSSCWFLKFSSRDLFRVFCVSSVNVSIQFNILASHLARGEVKSASHQIILFIEKTIPQFSFSLNSQYDHPYNDNKGFNFCHQCEAYNVWFQPMRRSNQTQRPPLVSSSLRGHFYWQNIDMIRFKLRRCSCMKYPRGVRDTVHQDSLTNKK